MATEKERADARVKVTNDYLVTFKYTGANGAMRSGLRLIPASTPVEARENAIRNLAQDYDWFKIGKITQEKSDHPQQKL